MRVKALLLLLLFVAPQLVELLHHHNSAGFHAYRILADKHTQPSEKVHAATKVCSICELIKSQSHEPFLLPELAETLLNVRCYGHFEPAGISLYVTYVLAYTNKGPPDLAATFV
jgi:hypothetical protein